MRGCGPWPPSLGFGPRATILASPIRACLCVGSWLWPPHTGFPLASGVPQRRCGAAQRWRSSTMACSVPQGRTSAAAVVAPFRLPLLVQGLQREEQQISGSCCSPGSAAAVGAAPQQRQRPSSAPWWRWRLSSRCGAASIRELQGGQELWLYSRSVLCIFGAQSIYTVFDIPTQIVFRRYS